ncbi:hypothetical protein G0D91_03825 [Burkholderia multivorans]|uniref:hypothetical protein n=1 Tax=Burkholderia multivorans TaxID=87883 RepID=UPI0019D2333F|nr:hypothetical protein [Burkholderia multivorans]MBN8162983.1 hypothetical protein [Burkholderia multivorans]MBN8173783.1 hypothetical protein [Burkholderia multivorans]QSL30223.1 hypothetical protein G0D91_03825 [Burkholderia multivorans]QSL35963.1 hypothetical protein G0D90_03825 [Burkholderia multivorans]QSL41703.1 hypothetical protein G0D89_03815 [Burkholderia multivorans]
MQLHKEAPGCPIDLYLIDNGGLGDVSAVTHRLNAQGIACHVLTGHGNVGYGRGHNLAIGLSARPLHLILNPDIDLDAQALVVARKFLDSHPDAGALAPRIGDESEVSGISCVRRVEIQIPMLNRSG